MVHCCISPLTIFFILTASKSNSQILSKKLLLGWHDRDFIHSAAHFDDDPYPHPKQYTHKRKEILASPMPNSASPAMALSPALLHSTASTFHGQFSVRLPSVGFAGVRPGGLCVKASSVVLFEKTDAEKVNRLKTTYLEKIVPLLKEEFNYTNIHEVSSETIRIFIFSIYKFSFIFKNLGLQYF